MLKRRDFLEAGIAAGAGLLLASSPEIAHAAAADDTLNVALLGAGVQGRTLMQAALLIPGVRFVAVCDIWKGRRTVEQFADADELWKKIDLDGWNEYDITARGQRVVTKINGQLMWEVTDREKGRHAEAPGVIALQLHVGPPMKVQFKDIRLKVLDEK